MDRGNWERDKATGECDMIYSNRDTFNGEYQNSRINGFGIYKFSNGD